MKLYLVLLCPSLVACSDNLPKKVNLEIGAAAVGSIEKSQALIHTTLPQKAIETIPILQEVVTTYWADFPIPTYYLAAQVEQETCSSLRSKWCWNSKAELKTAREYGFNLSQITIAYDKNGKERFNNFTEAKKLHPDLKDWSWQDRWSPKKGLMTMLFMVKREYSAVGQGTENSLDGMRFAWAAYNGGRRDLIKQKAICAAIKGCDPYKWFGHVELHSIKRATPYKGYSVSPKQINLNYVKNVSVIRFKKYVEIMKNAKL